MTDKLKCANPECDKEFVPNPNVKAHKYCSEKCCDRTNNIKYWKTHDSRKYRIKDNCSVCGNYRRIRQSDKKCSSCSNIEKHGVARVPKIGTCSICNRGPLTLSGTKCKSCKTHGKFEGIPYKISHGESLLRKRVEELYGKQHKLIFNYRDQWLKKKGLLEIDVAIPEIKLGFEFDGRPHCDPSHPGYLKTNENDLFKCNLAKNNGWVLIKIRSPIYVSNRSNFERVLNSIDAYYEEDRPIPSDITKNIAFAFDWGKIRQGEN